MYLSVAYHPLVPLDHEVPQIVVVSAAELCSKHKLVDASDWRGEHASVIAVGGALVNHHFVKDNRVELDLSETTLVGCKEKNSSPWDTDVKGAICMK